MKVATRAHTEGLQATVLRLTAVCVAGAALTAVCARTSFHLPFTPVPVTLQVFAVLLCGLTLGSRVGAASQMLYFAAGAAGLPVFSDARGAAALLGPTGGYFVGFVAAAFCAGLIMESIRSRPVPAAALGSAAGIFLIYFFGASWLLVWLVGTEGQEFGPALRSAWILGALPFVGVDCLKAVVAAAIALGAKRILPPSL